MPRLAEFELRILLTVLRCSEEAYAVAVYDDLRRRSRQRVSLGAVYVTLDRLAVKGLLSSRLGEPVAARGGRAKRFYTLTPRGLSLVRAECAAIQRLWTGLGVVEAP